MFHLSLHIQWWKICFSICLSFNPLFSSRCYSPSVAETSSQPIWDLLFLWVAIILVISFANLVVSWAYLRLPTPLQRQPTVSLRLDISACHHPEKWPLTHPYRASWRDACCTVPRLCLWGWELFCLMVHHIPTPLTEFCCQPGAPCLFSDSTSLSVPRCSASHAITLVSDPQKLLGDTLSW